MLSTAQSHGKGVVSVAPKMGLRSRRVEVKLRISSYVSNIAPKAAEYNPLVKVYLDQDCDREAVGVRLDPTRPTASSDVVITGVPKHEKLHNLFAIGFKSYVWSHTHTGIPVESETGTDHIYVRDIVLAHIRGVPYTKVVELRMKSVDNLLKGSFTVTIAPGDLHLGSTPLDMQDTYASRLALGDQNARAVASKLILSYIQSVAEAHQKLPQRSKTGSRVLMFVYMGAAGLEILRNIPIPVDAFVLYEIPKSNALFWRNACAMVMARRGKHLSDWSAMTVRTRATVMKEVICYAVQYLPYKSDEVDRNKRHTLYKKILKVGIEDFESALEKGSGDCEDLAEAIMMCKDALAAFTFDRNKEPVLADLADLARRYVTGLVLCTVTSAAITGQDDSNENLGAHMAGLAVSNRRVYEWIKRGNAAVAAQLPFDPTYFAAGEGEELHTQELEGTGQYYSRDLSPGDQASEYAMQELAADPCFAAMKTPIIHKYGERSAFYRHAMSIVFPDFARKGSPYISFWFVDSRDGKEGVAFEDIENNEPHVTLVPRPGIPEKVMEIMRQVTKIRVPPNPLVLSDTRNPMTIRNKYADQVVAAIDALGRVGPPGDVIPVQKETRHNLFREQEAQMMIRALTNHMGVYRVAYDTELIMDGESPGIRFRIYDATREAY